MELRALMDLATLLWFNEFNKNKFADGVLLLFSHQMGQCSAPGLSHVLRQTALHLRLSLTCFDPPILHLSATAIAFSLYCKILRACNFIPEPTWHFRAGVCLMGREKARSNFSRTHPDKAYLQH